MFQQEPYHPSIQLMTFRRQQAYLLESHQSVYLLHVSGTYEPSELGSHHCFCCWPVLSKFNQRFEIRVQFLSRFRDILRLA